MRVEWSVELQMRTIAQEQSAPSNSEGREQIAERRGQRSSPPRCGLSVPRSLRCALSIAMELAPCGGCSASLLCAALRRTVHAALCGCGDGAADGTVVWCARAQWSEHSVGVQQGYAGPLMEQIRARARSPRLQTNQRGRRAQRHAAHSPTDIRHRS